MSYLAGEIFLSYSIFFESEAFAEEAFFYFLVFGITSDFFSYLTLKTSTFIEDSPGNKHSQLANQSQINRILLLIFDWSDNQMC